MHRALLLSLPAVTVALASAAALAQVPLPTSAPPAVYRPSGPALPVPKLLLDAGAPTRTVALPEPSVAERAQLKSANSRAAGKQGRSAKGPLMVGYGRSIPAADQAIELSALEWTPTAEGGRAARIAIESPGAAALRVALRLTGADPDLAVRFAGSASYPGPFGPVPASAIAEATARDGVYWSPVLQGGPAIVELHAAAGAKLAGVTLSLARVSHLALAGADLKRIDAKRAIDIGDSGPCEIDLKCVTPQSQALVDAGNAVGKLLFTTDDGFTALCTGQLLNDSVSSNTPYLFTANHCLTSSATARTINVYWFFDAVGCGVNTVPPFALQTGGAMMLARSDDWDWALVRLYGSPPLGVRLSAWRAEPVPQGAIGSVIHHPQGDLKKWSQGTSPGYRSYTDGSSFIRMVYSQASTEGGSSGAGLLTFLAQGGYYEVRGGLYGGDASCTNTTGDDEYSRLDDMLPLTRQYLTPGQAQAGLAVVVEFYNRFLDHYFITSAPAEINDLDTGVHPGWERTGLRFLAYSVPTAGANPVCRFYLRPEVGDSHFYSGSPQECADTAVRFGASWIYESPNVFYIPLPTLGGVCPAGTKSIWRFFNTLTTNHRYVAEVFVRDDLRSKGFWIPEGYGPDAVIMCSPLGS